MPPVGFVSCDIVGHSAVKDLSIQRRRLEAINGLVHDVLERSAPADIVWASGGDGGHTVFCQEDWPGAAAQFLINLRLWSQTEGVNLRIIGHCGDVERLTGADGRTQLIGEGINLAGALLALAFPQGVLVTTSFQAALEKAGVSGLLFHDPRLLQPKHFTAQKVYLLSAPGRFQSHWDRPAGGDRDLLEQVLADGQAWRALYLIKRLLQTNSLDDQAEEAIDQLGPHLLVYREQTLDADGRMREHWAPNPFLSNLDAHTRRHVVRAGQLVERRRGEVLSRAGETGDTMFIVLDGAVGVFPSDPGPAESNLGPRYVAGPGEIVGELGFTLHRPRTADLVAVEDCSLLSAHAAALQAQARNNPALAANLEKFLTRRTLEYVCRELGYLIGRDGAGPLAEMGRKNGWDRLAPHTEKITCPLADPRMLTLEDPRFAGDGLYILVSGQLRSPAHNGKTFSGADLPLIFIDLPGWMVCPNHQYRPEGSDAIFLRIGKEALLGRRPVIDAVTARLIREVPHLYHFDVFLSYTFDDAEQGRRWHDALEAAGLRVYMEVSATGHYFRDRIEAGILDALTLVALVSAHTMTRPLEQNWVRQEIAFRQAAFEATTARIFPVRLKGGRPEVLADGYTIIESVGREEAAVAEVIEGVRLTRKGDGPVPFSLSRKVHTRLG